MKRYDVKLGFNLTSKQKKEIKKMAKKLDISMSEYLRCLAKIDVGFADVEKYNQLSKNKLHEIEVIKARIGAIR